MSTKSSPGSALGMMLILSAIDMLIASLVGMIGLFVVLVGGDASNVVVMQDAGPSMAASIIEAFSADGAGGLAVSGLQGRRGHRKVPIDDLGKQILPGNSWLVQTFILIPGLHSFTVDGGDTAELVIHSGSGKTYEIALRCGAISRPITFIFEPALKVDGSCNGYSSKLPAPQPAPVRFLKGARIIAIAERRTYSLGPGWQIKGSQIAADGSLQLFGTAIQNAIVDPGASILGVLP